MALTCPRCQLKMSVATVQPPGAETALSVDHCDGCGGHWLDANEARHVAPFFAYLERRHVEIALLGNPGTFGCLRCAAGMQLFRLLDVEIDFCLACSGLWIDGAEANGRVNLADAKVARGHIYRTVQKTQNLAQVHCAACQRTVPTEQTYVAGVGLICRPCFFAISQRHQELRAAEHEPVAPAAAAAPAEPLFGVSGVEALEGLRRILAASHRALFGGSD